MWILLHLGCSLATVTVASPFFALSIFDRCHNVSIYFLSTTLRWRHDSSSSYCVPLDYRCRIQHCRHPLPRDCSRLPVEGLIQFGTGEWRPMYSAYSGMPYHVCIPSLQVSFNTVNWKGVESGGGQHYCMKPVWGTYHCTCANPNMIYTSLVLVTLMQKGQPFCSTVLWSMKNVYMNARLDEICWITNTLVVDNNKGKGEKNKNRIFDRDVYIYRRVPDNHDKNPIEISKGAVVAELYRETQYEDKE
jgi:hypothetical protein